MDSGVVYERWFLDVRVFNPHALSNKNISIHKCYRKHEMEKKRMYEQTTREVGHATFTSLVFSASGGFGKEATTFYKRLASSFEHWDQPYSGTMNWLRCTISFSLLRSAIQCIQGARSSRGHFVKSGSTVDLVTAETDLEWGWSDFVKLSNTCVIVVVFNLRCYLTLFNLRICAV